MSVKDLRTHLHSSQGAGTYRFIITSCVLIGSAVHVKADNIQWVAELGSTHQTYPVSSNGVRLVSGYVLRFLKQVRYNSKLKLYFWKKWSEQLSLTVHQRTV